MAEKKEKTITLDLKVCLVGEEYELSTLPTAPRLAGIEHLHLTRKGPDYLPFLHLGQVEVPLSVFEAIYKVGGKALEEALAEYLNKEVKKKIQGLK